MGIPEFDPAAARMLAMFGRLAHGEGAVGADEVIGALVAEDDPIGQELSRDPKRASRVLEQLRSNGLLASASSSERYRLTTLGRARVERRDRED
jgi:DNA-binding IclR family transcriptional regulator